MRRIKKRLEKAHLLKNYGSWIYCDSCNKTVAYLCYVNYDYFKLAFKCNCGDEGVVELADEQKQEYTESDQDLIIIKNRLCCPNDHAPLFSIVGKNVTSCSWEIVCNKCNSYFHN